MNLFAAFYKYVSGTVMMIGVVAVTVVLIAAGLVVLAASFVLTALYLVRHGWSGWWAAPIGLLVWSSFFGVVGSRLDRGLGERMRLALLRGSGLNTKQCGALARHLAMLGLFAFVLLPRWIFQVDPQSDAFDTRTTSAFVLAMLPAFVAWWLSIESVKQ